MPFILARPMSLGATMSRWRYAIVFLVLAAAAPVATAEDRPLKDRFLAAYSEGYHRLETFYRNLDLTEETTGPGCEKIFGGPMTFHWRAKGDKFRDDLISLSGAISGSRLSRGDLNCRVSRTGDKKTRATQPPTYAITEIHPGDDDSLIHISRLVSARLAFAPYCYCGGTVMDLVHDEYIELKSLEEIEPGKMKLMFTSRSPEGRTWNSEIVFDKARSWAILSYRRDPRSLVNVEYGESIDGVPVATRVTRYWNGDFKTPAFTSVLKEIKPGPVPDSVFTLADFGLPELPQPKKPGFPIFTTLGVVGLLLALVLAWFLRRRARAAATPQPAA